MQRIGKFLILLVGLGAAWLCTTAMAAPQARAWLDRNSMHMGETVTLNVEVGGDTSAAQPDFSVLEGDFDLLGTQSSSSMNIVNGQSSSKLLWAVGLQPKRAGTLTIPAFSVGAARTEPLQLDVLPAPSGAIGKAGDDLFVTVDATPHAPYVQQEIRVTVKLYYALSLLDGNLDDPKADGLIVRKLGTDANYTADIDGRRYRVVERHYAAAAENSGTFELPAVKFRGRAMNSNDINSFFSRGRNVAAQSEPIALDVHARPPASGNDLWLPAQSLSLTAEGLDAGTKLHAGEPLTLTLHLKAQGLGFEQLPELKLPPIDGAQVYPDKETTQNRDDGSWVYGSRERKFAIVPAHAGTLTLPPISVAWWDTEHDKAALSQIPAQTITVLPAPAGPAPAPAPPAQAVPPTQATAQAAASAAPLAVDNGDAASWRRLAIAALALWLLTVIAALLLWRRARGKAPVVAATPAAPAAGNAEFRSACKRGDLAAAARALLRRARRERPALRNLGELVRALGDEQQRVALLELERALYGSGASAGVSDRLLAAFRDGPQFAPATANTAASVLPALYPFDLQRERAAG
jgi:hypothetical protein